MKLVWSVGRVASWDGFCLPCGRDDRPLVLTRGGPAGLRAWMAGIDDDERTLVLTCRVCGDWQDVPLLEEDDPEMVVPCEVSVEVPALVGPTLVPSLERTVKSTVALPTLDRPPLRTVPTPVPVDAPAVAIARSILSAAG